MSSHTTQDLLPGVDYNHKRDHHTRRSGKSLWTIACPEEEGVFVHAYTTSRRNTTAWGMHVQKAAPSYLGLSASGRRVFVAKFVTATGYPVWHGYPADHVAHAQDKPPPDILTGWNHSGILPTAKMRKLERGQPCNL